jgi:hypothetical protein
LHEIGAENGKCELFSAFILLHIAQKCRKDKPKLQNAIAIGGRIW